MTEARALGLPDFVLLPGTKKHDGRSAVAAPERDGGGALAPARGRSALLGVCGGYQMLGEALDDPEGTESGRPYSLRGLGLLPVRTVFASEKTCARLPPWRWPQPFAGARLEGYEIHMGRTESRGAPSARWKTGAKTDAAAAWCGAPISTACSTPGR